MRGRHRCITHRASRCGFTIVEAVFSIVLVSGLVVVALDTVGASTVARQKLGSRSHGRLLARDLMSEIMARPYAEPVETSGFGPESSETGGTRLNFDDVDDCDDWSASPPQLGDGSEIASLEDWGRSVAVDYINASNMDVVIASDAGVKRVTVTVTYKGAEVLSMVAIRTDAP